MIAWCPLVALVQILLQSISLTLLSCVRHYMAPSGNPPMKKASLHFPFTCIGRSLDVLFMSLCPDACISTLQKVIVLSVNGVLCFEDYNGFNPPVLHLANVISRPGVHDFFRILLQVFHVGIWSCMPPLG